MDQSLFEASEALIEIIFFKESQVTIYQKNQIRIISMHSKHAR